MSVKMNDVRKVLMMVEEKFQRFKQQQFTFIAALERSREHAHHRTQPVSTVNEVQWYMTQHCSNTTDMQIFSLFLDIMNNLKDLFYMIESLASARNYAGDVLNSYRNVFSPEYNFSQFRTHYQYNGVNRLSCDEAQNYYGGVISVIPVILDLLKEAITDLSQASKKMVPEMENTTPVQQRASNNAQVRSVKKTYGSRRSSKSTQKAADGWKPSDGWKPAWKPPGPGRK
ncbi:sperm acrosome-associated protein 9 [Tachysurus fulvidraco]|uniref:sperm acrosome-associated protein 9 n=1 Tax=Tachysurus fulvidraco TaxID=1234273 RepID=UPI000F4F517D|nr:sperm acrosome-associated protein 9 [Tachysurus fulvidraco]XP_027018594.1 sperm acrosome-associated protein 9 [Tachysurus fulvidraco]